MHSLAFEWVMKCDTLIPQAENLPYRSYVLSILGQLVKALARGRLEAIAAVFFKSLKMRIGSESPILRQEILSLLTAMKYIELSFDSDTNMAAAVNFLDHAAPLKHVAQYKKSQVWCKCYVSRSRHLCLYCR